MKLKFLPIVLAVVILILLVQSAFVVNEWEQVIITRFGQPVRDPILEPGLKFKLPFLEQARRFDRRFLEWSGGREELPTKDKVFIQVDTYARWRITDPLRFLERLRDENRAQTRRHDLIEVIRSTNRTPAQDASQSDDEMAFMEISIGRDDIRLEILAAVGEKVEDLGIEVLDVQFRRINYGETVRPDVYNRMISERRRISDRFRSEGQGEASRILGEMDRDLKDIQSTAYRTAQEIIGHADAEAIEIFARAYNQSADSRSFYQFLKTMETYTSTVDENTSLLLSTSGEFFKFLKAPRP